MEAQLLVPGVEHGGAADAHAAVPWIGGDGAQRLGHRLEQDVEDELLLPGERLRACDAAARAGRSTGPVRDAGGAPGPGGLRDIRASLEGSANPRRHAATGEQPVDRFESDERDALLPLAVMPYRRFGLRQAAEPRPPRIPATVEVERRPLSVYAEALQ